MSVWMCVQWISIPFRVCPYHNSSVPGIWSRPIIILTRTKSLLIINDWILYLYLLLVSVYYSIYYRSWRHYPIVGNFELMHAEVGRLCLPPCVLHCSVTQHEQQFIGQIWLVRENRPKLGEGGRRRVHCDSFSMTQSNFLSSPQLTWFFCFNRSLVYFMMDKNNLFQ